MLLMILLVVLVIAVLGGGYGHSRVGYVGWSRRHHPRDLGGAVLHRSHRRAKLVTS